MDDRVSNAFGKAMCHALGIDPHIVQAITVHEQAQQPTIFDVTVSTTLDDTQLLALADTLIANGQHVKVNLKRGV